MRSKYFTLEEECLLLSHYFHLTRRAVKVTYADFVELMFYIQVWHHFKKIRYTLVFNIAILLKM